MKIIATPPEAMREEDYLALRDLTRRGWQFDFFISADPGFYVRSFDNGAALAWLRLGKPESLSTQTFIG